MSVSREDIQKWQDDKRNHSPAHKYVSYDKNIKVFKVAIRNKEKGYLVYKGHYNTYEEAKRERNKIWGFKEDVNEKRERVEKFLEGFSKERNITESTIKGYVSGLLDYSDFNNMELEELLAEAEEEEKKRIPLKERSIRKRLLDYRSHLIGCDFAAHTVKTYFAKVKSFYLHYDVELPHLPDMKLNRDYVVSFEDLPTKEQIDQALEICSVEVRALILFMSSSGTAKAETLSLTVRQFIEGTRDYHSNGELKEVLEELKDRRDVVPTLYLRRIKTDKYYYTFCSPEASHEIVLALSLREDLKLDDKLFPFTDSWVISMFQRINDEFEWGKVGNYRRFRTHTMRKYHASNIQLPAEYIDSLEGRSKDEVHETYIKTSPEKLKKIYMGAMGRVMIHPEKWGENKATQEDSIVNAPRLQEENAFNSETITPKIVNVEGSSSIISNMNMNNTGGIFHITLDVTQENLPRVLSIIQGLL